MLLPRKISPRKPPKRTPLVPFSAETHRPRQSGRETLGAPSVVIGFGVFQAFNEVSQGHAPLRVALELVGQSAERVE